MKHWIIVIALGLLFVSLKSHAAVNLQTCSGTLAPGAGLLGCPQLSLGFTPVSPKTLVRSIVDNTQGFRAFGSLSSADQVYAADGNWHVLSTIQPALQPITPAPPTPAPPVVVPPPASLTQDVLITLVGGKAPQSVIFSGVPVPACFSIGSSKQVCLP